MQALLGPLLFPATILKPGTPVALDSSNPLARPSSSLVLLCWDLTPIYGSDDQRAEAVGKSEEGKHCPSLMPHLKPLYHLQASLLQGREGHLCRPKWFRELWGISLKYIDTDIPTPRIKGPTTSLLGLWSQHRWLNLADTWVSFEVLPLLQLNPMPAWLLALSASGYRCKNSL